MPLEIAFQTKELRATCESPARAKRELGELESKVLFRLLADMNAVETVGEMFEMGLDAESCTQGQGMLRFQLGLSLNLYCTVSQQNVPIHGAAIDWSQVTRLKIVHIGSSI